jgi:DedD protein
MKLVIDEKLKHRLIGLAVVISLGAIFAPAMMKKPIQNLENNYSVRVQLPPKPSEPHVALADEREVFKTIKISKVHIPEVSAESQLPELAKAEVLHSDVIASRESPSIEEQPADKAGVESINSALEHVAQNTVKQAQLAVNKPRIGANTKAVAYGSVKTIQKSSGLLHTQPQAIKVANRTQSRLTPKELFAVQVASFSQLGNAQSLVNKLHSKGYKARFTKVAGKHGVTYKVYAGHSPQKMDVIKLKTQLANAMQLNGFIVNTGVS